MAKDEVPTEDEQNSITTEEARTTEDTNLANEGELNII